MAHGQLLFIVTVLTLVWGSWGDLSCDSHLRIIFPEWFTHCGSCTYTDWSEWQFVQDSIVDVPTSQCESGQSYTESRSRSAIGYGCVSETQETQAICLPDREDRFITALGLGSQSAEISPEEYLSIVLGVNTIHRQQRRQTVSQTSENRCPVTGNNGEICTDPSYGSRGGRSLKKEYRPFRRATQERKEPAPLPEAPIPYDMKEHGERFRRSIQAACQPNGEQYILFVLDTSGSIGEVAFNQTTDAVSKLTALFCRPPKVAVMTFDDYFHLEFCFDCYPTNITGRALAREAIKNIQYRGGMTYTGGAARCVCDELLTPACGMHTNANCIDVIFITDGQSNDPSLEVCEEVECLHSHLNGVNTYGIGIKNYNEDEIQCITSSSNSLSVFSYEDFDDFVEGINEIISRLMTQSSLYRCTHSKQGHLCGS